MHDHGNHHNRIDAETVAGVQEKQMATSLVPDNPGLYRRALGDAFETLPAVLRRFHDEPEEATAQGLLCITRGQGWLRQALATLMRLPPQGEQVPVLLRVHIDGDTERWTRDFGSLGLVTRQWLYQGLLIETAGPLRFGFRLAADAAGMRFEFVRCWLFRLPLPYVLAPRVNASVSEHENGWWVKVRVEVPILGLLTQYEGKVTPKC